ncbi:MAG TPA: tetratricopeptide repeat protein [Novosphingobium sp.]|nr:tetratricopeptide repeat protein [Novosphingobium sp.]
MVLPFPLFAQVSAAIAAPTVEDDRLRLCVERAASDPATALAEAGAWVAESRGAGRSKPLQCLGHVYAVLVRWDAAEAAFAEAAQVAAPGDPLRLAALRGQAGNAALAGNKADRALAHFDAALAQPSGEPAARGQLELDRARALVALERPEDAQAALVAAQRDAPDEPLVWLLSATLARRQGDLAAAQRMIEVAASLDPNDPEIGLEAGVIAVLDGRDAAARQSWQSVRLTAPGSKAAETAKAYLDQLDPATQTR